MRLNIHQIFERIPCKVEILFEREHETEIINVRGLKEPAEGCNGQTLYIVDGSREKFLPPVQPAHLLFVSRIPIKVKVEETLSCTLLREQDISVEKLLYTVQDVITWFQLWEQRVYASILQESSLSETLNLCAEALQNPIAVFDLQQNLLFSAGEIPQISAKSGLWDYALNHGRAPQEEEIASDMDKELSTQRTPFYYQSKNQFRNIKRLLAPLYYQNSLFGLLALSDITQPFSPGEYLNVCQIQHYMEQAIAHTKDFYFTNPHIPWYMAQLLRGQRVNNEVLRYNARKAGFDLNKHYFLWTFQRFDPGENAIESLVPNISYTLNTSLVYTYANQIVVIDQNLERYRDQSVLGKLHSFLTRNHLRFGQSMVFPHLEDLHTAFMQSQIALGQHLHDEGTFFVDSYPDYIVKAIRDLEESAGLVYPTMNCFFRIREDYRRELLVCLEKFIACGLNLSATAKALFIHRHTVIYRVEKIEGILQVKLQELSQNELELIRLSCRLMLAEE